MEKKKENNVIGIFMIGEGERMNFSMGLCWYHFPRENILFC
jgi:hypothetical protein